MLAQLLIGLVLVVAVYAALGRLTPLTPVQRALIVALCALAAYIPYALWRWPGADVVALHVTVYLMAAYLLGLLGSHRAARRGGERWFHWGPAILVTFFVVIVLMSAVMIVVSQQGLPEGLQRLVLPQSDAEGPVQSAFPGVVKRDLQKKEELYNQYLAQIERQRALGWQIEKGWVGAAVAGEPAVFQIRVTQRDGEPLSNAAVEGVFLRPADSRKDQSFAMRENSPGVYRAEVVLPAPGVWELMLNVRRGKDLYELRASTDVAGRP